MRAIRRWSVGILAGVALVSLMGGCIYDHHHPATSSSARAGKGGPPPWAPAHGYRHQNREGVELRFDSGLGVYVVVGHGGHYFYGDRYFRQFGGDWRVSVSIDGPWAAVQVDAVPPGIRRHKGKHKHHGKRGRGHGPPAKRGH